MSIYSGKCDLADTISIYGMEDFINRADIYYADSPVPLRVESEKDIVPFYPFIVYTMFGSKEGRLTLHIGNRSFVDTEEEEHLGWYLKDVLRYYNKCKRKKKPFIVDDAVKEVGFFSNKDLLREVAERVAEKGKKADIKGLHDNLHEYYRMQLFDEMVRVGYTPFHAKLWIWGTVDFSLVPSVNKEKDSKDGEEKEDE